MKTQKDPDSQSNPEQKLIMLGALTNKISLYYITIVFTQKQTHRLMKQSRRRHIFKATQLQTLTFFIKTSKIHIHGNTPSTNNIGKTGCSCKEE